jgi:transketolase
MTAGVEVTTGPLGQGICNAVGLAMAEAHLAAKFNKPGFNVVDHYTYVIMGDGCNQEGVASEACSLAGHLGLGKLIALYDDNHITIDGATSLSFTEDVAKRFEAYGWHVQTVTDGDTSLTGIQNALETAYKITDKPHLIKIRTTIGFGSAHQGEHKVHGSPLGAEDIANVKKKFGFDPAQSFFVPEEVKNFYGKLKEKGQATESAWNEMFKKYSQEHADLAAELTRRMEGKLPANWKSALPVFKPEDAAKATRQFSQTVINSLAKVLPELMGGSADLNPSTLSYIDISKDYQKNTPEGRNIRFGVREHGMAAICNGLEAYGGIISYGATFLNFIGYAMGAVRLSAISHFGVLYVMTHDSIGLGEDGPTHQPIESLMMIRATPNILLLRPADGNETSGAYGVAIENRNRPSVLALSRQAVPNLKGTSIEGVYKGAYTISDPAEGKPQIILLGTGTELSLCVEAAGKLSNLKVRVVSMPSWELFREQAEEYKRSVLLDGVPILAVEAASVVGWHEYAHAVIGMSTFGDSGPYKDVFAKFGITTDNVVKKAQAMVDYYSKHSVPSKIDIPF